MTTQLLTPAEAAQFLRRAPGTLANWRHQGIGPAFVRQGHTVLYPAAALDAWLTKNLIGSRNA